MSEELVLGYGLGRNGSGREGTGGIDNALTLVGVLVKDGEFEICDFVLLSIVVESNMVVMVVLTLAIGALIISFVISPLEDDEADRLL